MALALTSSQVLVCRGVPSAGGPTARRCLRLLSPPHSQDPISTPLLQQQRRSGGGRGGRAYSMSVATATSMWEDVLEVYDRAARVGAAFKTETTRTIISDGGVDFVVRVAEALKSKPKGIGAEGGGKPPKEFRNPFLPYEEDLFVRNLSDTHLILLNKFNVVEHHLLVVTRAFESQTDPLNARDLEAVWMTLQGMPGGGLAFYNCGEHSGRSQPHKHVQVVPTPFTAGAPLPTPVSGEIARAAQAAGGGVFSVPTFPFSNFVAQLPGRGGEVSGEGLEEVFGSLLDRCRAAAGGGESALSYNVVMTADWMMLVNRRAERVGPVAANALGFAGTLLVRSEEELQYVKDEGPMTILAALGVPKE